MWEMTAAQRDLLLSRPEEDEKRTELEKKMPERYSMDRIMEIVRRHNAGDKSILDVVAEGKSGESSPQEDS